MQYPFQENLHLKHTESVLDMLKVLLTLIMNMYVLLLHRVPNSYFLVLCVNLVYILAFK